MWSREGGVVGGGERGGGGGRQGVREGRAEGGGVEGGRGGCGGARKLRREVKGNVSLSIDGRKWPRKKKCNRKGKPAEKHE